MITKVKYDIIGFSEGMV